MDPTILGPGAILRPQAPGAPAQGTKATPAPATGPDFRTVFQRQLDREKLKFSLHAQERLAGSNNPLSQTDLDRLDRAVDKAAAKGAKESLILMRDLAFVVSVPNRTVITAVDGQRMKENVFTNIDSAVII